MITHFEHIDDIFHFGKFTGCTLAEVLTYNPSYLEWVVKNVDWYYCSLSESALKEIRMMFPHLVLPDIVESVIRELQDDRNSSTNHGNVICCNNSYQSNDDEPTYERYAGTYAQDVMGYSDDDIDTIFDGEPDAYWNID